MRKREMVRYLKNHGYSFLKHGKKHEHWVKGTHRIILSMGKAVDDRLSKKIKLDVKRGCPRYYCEEQ